MGDLRWGHAWPMCLMLCGLLGACVASKQQGGMDGDGDGGDGDKGRNGDGDADGDGDDALSALDACLESRTMGEIVTTSVDKVDLLFVVDNSGSMAEEQASLRAQFPKLIRTLSSGERMDNQGAPTGEPFPPVRDLHLAVVSSDMGLVGVSGIDKCEGFGDDGRMQRTPPSGAMGCPSPVPTFLRYSEGGGKPHEQVADEFGCIATLGTEGCGFEQQLEAGLKALWPAVDIDPSTAQQWVDPMTGMPGNRITFLRDRDGNGRLGHGGPPGGGTANAGFLRNDPSVGQSLVAIVVVTDEEDCSSLRTDHFQPPMALGPNDPLRQQDLNLRCYFNQDSLYRIDRYVQGFKALRPGNENLVVFAAIAGVPTDLVSPAALERYDLSDEADRSEFYTDLLNDNRMQEMIDNSLPMGSRALIPSCDVPGVGTAYPPRRLVQVARGFGANGIVQSICQDDYGPAMDAIVDVIARQLGAPCLPRQLFREADGKVDCKLIWELPLPNTAPMDTPTTCEAAPYLSEPEAESERVTPDGRTRCQVRQLAVNRDQVEQPDGIQGWFYDDFSEGARSNCAGNHGRRVAFSAGAVPPTGVTVQLDCRNVLWVAPGNRDAIPDQDGRIAQIGDDCRDTGDVGCVVQTPGGPDDSMFCHAERNQCMRGCDDDTDCPAGWACDARPETTEASGNGPLCAPTDC